MNEFHCSHEYRWHRRKKYACYLLMYAPPAIVIGMMWGLWYETMWIVGGLYMQLIDGISEELAYWS